MKKIKDLMRDGHRLCGEVQKYANVFGFSPLDQNEIDEVSANIVGEEDFIGETRIKKDLGLIPKDPEDSLDRSHKAQN